MTDIDTQTPVRRWKLKENQEEKRFNNYICKDSKKKKLLKKL